MPLVFQIIRPLYTIMCVFHQANVMLQDSDTLTVIANCDINMSLINISVLLHKWWLGEVWAVCGPKINISPTNYQRTPHRRSTSSPPQHLINRDPTNYLIIAHISINSLLVTHNKINTLSMGP